MLVLDVSPLSGADPVDVRNGGFGVYPDFLTKTSVDNPEYHIVQPPEGAAHAVGLPLAVQQLQQQQRPPFVTQQRSSEEESDHEYYNDFDRLRRELQPLRRNETTV